MAPAPFTPLVSTPVHCDTLHWQLETLLLQVMVSGPLPRVALSARYSATRFWGMPPCPAKVTVATWVPAAIPAPDNVGLGAAPTGGSTPRCRPQPHVVRRRDD